MSPASRKICLISTFADACGGSEGRAIALYRLLRDRADVELWSEQEPDAALVAEHPIQRIRLLQWRFPRDADLVFVGAPRFGRWVHLARARRITLVYNSDTPARLARRIKRLRRVPKDELRLVFASERIAASVPYEGTVQVSPIDLERFRPVARSGVPFRVGRMSRDVRYKHGETDPDLYRRLALAGCEVRVRGGTCLTDEIGDDARIRLEPASPEKPEHFLQGLDCFLYRTRADWFEASARVVVEALACGVPIVAHARGGYTDYVDHGSNGFVFETDDEAFDHIMALERDPDLLARMRAAARRSAEELYSDAELDEIAAFYVG